MKKLSVALLALAALSLCINFTCIYAPKRFAIKNFRPKGLSLRESDATLPAETWHYLGHGKQAIVFATETYVLKLFYVKRPLHEGWYRHIESWLRLASPHFPYTLYQRKKAYRKLLHSYRLAFEKLPQETGLITAHLAPSSAPLPAILIDRDTRAHHVDLSALPFVVQERAELAPKVLKERGKEAITAIEALLQARLEKGLIDRNQVFQKNYGFVGTKAIQLDPGRLEEDPDRAEATRDEALKRFHKYLIKRDFS